jgi:hypothetical protein
MKVQIYHCVPHSWANITWPKISCALNYKWIIYPKSLSRLVKEMIPSLLNDERALCPLPSSSRMNSAQLSLSPPSASFLLGLLFNLEDGGGMFFQNVKLSVNTGCNNHLHLHLCSFHRCNPFPIGLDIKYVTYFCSSNKDSYCQKL